MHVFYIMALWVVVLINVSCQLTLYILVTDTKILYSNLNLVKSSHIMREKASFLACFTVHGNPLTVYVF